ncbi:MAG: TonB family protein, partial [Kofleriaceae bacterium]|nr:TonB family protein [Kofleriaceae bacterium]
MACRNPILFARFALVVLFLAAAIRTPHAQGTPEDEPPPVPRADEKLTPPTLKRDMQPVYPDRAKEEGIAAEVLLDIDIDAAGLVENARVVKGAGPQGYGFDDAAVIAAKQLL